MELVEEVEQEQSVELEVIQQEEMAEQVQQIQLQEVQ
jgi:hypothetical protein